MRIFLTQLGTKITEGQVILGRGREEITLQAPHNLILEIQVEDEDKNEWGLSKASGWKSGGWQ